jgi:hypothetical protein
MLLLLNASAGGEVVGGGDYGLVEFGVWASLGDCRVASFGREFRKE